MAGFFYVIQLQPCRYRSWLLYNINSMVLQQLQIVILLAIALLVVCTSQNEIVIPLAYTTDPTTQIKYPIKIAFDSSATTSPFNSTYLPLFNYNISLETSPSQLSGAKEVVIGLQHPSAFLAAVMETFKVEARQIEFGKEEYLQMIINGNNFVESRDDFVNGDTYGVRAKYNFGDALSKSSQKCYLVDDDAVYFDEFLILEILNSMDQRNGIHFKQDEKKGVIELTGNIQNFPKISFTRGKSIFEVEIKEPLIRYLPRGNSSEALNMIGYRALKKFSKFEIHESVVSFKRTSQLYQLYLYLGYFITFALLFLLVSHVALEDAMKFIRSLVDWVVFQKREGRIRVLRSELE